MWIDKSGSNFTTQQVADIVYKSTGGGMIAVAGTAIGRIYENGSIWFQRIS